MNEEKKKLLVCVMCKEQFKNTPVILSCCKKTICQSHIPTTLKVFICQLCNSAHDMEKNKTFETNAAVQDLLKINILEQINGIKCLDTNLGRVYEMASEEVESLKNTFNDLNHMLNAPSDYIRAQVKTTRTKIEMRRIEIKLQIDKVFDAMNQNLLEYTSECIQNIKDLNLQQTNETLLNEVSKNLKDWLTNNVLLVSDDDQRKEIQLKAQDLYLKLTSLINQVDKDLLMNQNWDLIPNNKFIEELEKELVHLDGPTHTIELELENFQQKGNKMHCSSVYKFDNKYRWWLVFERNVVNCDFVGIYLRCKSSKPNFPVYVNPTFAITNHKNKKEEFKEADSGTICYQQSGDLGMDRFLKFEDLINPENGWYDAENDKVTIKVEFDYKHLRNLKTKQNTASVTGNNLKNTRNAPKKRRKNSL